MPKPYSVSQAGLHTSTIKFRTPCTDQLLLPLCHSTSTLALSLQHFPLICDVVVALVLVLRHSICSVQQVRVSDPPITHNQRPNSPKMVHRLEPPRNPPSLTATACIRSQMLPVQLSSFHSHPLPHYCTAMRCAALRSHPHSGKQTNKSLDECSFVQVCTRRNEFVQYSTVPPLSPSPSLANVGWVPT